MAVERAAPGPPRVAATARNVVLAFAIGAAGGALFWALALPLPWMLGALIACMAAATFGLPVAAPERLRPPVVAVIGVMLGSGFTPDLLAQAGNWAISLAFLALYLAAAAVIVVPYYRIVGGFDPVTAYFAGMPGGLNEMVTIGRAQGGDERRIILAHATRIVITVFLIAFWFRLVEGVPLLPGTARGISVTAIPWPDLAILVVCAVVGSVLGKLLRLPAPTLIGPMLVSGIVHITGVTANAPPTEVVLVAQLLLGTIMGCRFQGSTPRMIGQALALSLGATLLTLCLTLAFAVLFHGLFAQPVRQVILAYAPGGLTEMSLIALSMRAEVAYVAAHHIARIAMLIALAPLVLGWVGPLTMRRGQR